MIRLQELRKRYGDVEAVAGIDLEIERGEFFGLLGPNGAGKTTTLKLILGLTRPNGGSVHVFDSPVDGPSPERNRRIGVVFEKANIYGEASVEDNLLYTATLFGAPVERVDRLIRDLGLEPHRKKKGNALSKGLRQRTALARALVHDPELLILDEPTSGLDPDVAQQVRSVVQDLHGQGKTVLLISHLMHEVEQLCTRVAIINRGRIQVEGSVPELRDRYSENVTVRLRAAPEILTEVASWNGLSVVERGADLQTLEGQWGQVWPMVEKLVSRPALREEIKELHMSGLSFEDVYIRVVNE